MESLTIILENSGEEVHNDVVYNRIFDLKNYSYNFVLTPLTTFWRFGIRLSKTDTVSFFHPGNRYKEPEFWKEFIDLHVATGEWDNEIWRGPSRFRLVQYNLPGYEHDLVPPNDSYVEKGYVRWGMRLEGGTLNINGKAEGCPLLQKQVNIPEGFRYFKVFAWADHTAFKIKTAIIITDLLEKPERNFEKSHDNTHRFDNIINGFIDGNEEQRSDLLRSIQSHRNLDKAAFSSRLRLEIKTRFRSGIEKQTINSIRAPDKITSVRSWLISALIWTDAEGKENREILTNHLNFNTEPDENIRYWTLAGLYEQQVSYLGEAIDIAMLSYSGTLPLFARAMQNPLNDKLIVDFRTALFSGQFEETWQILRILRIVSIPPLVSDLCSFLVTHAQSLELTYDTFYALSNPGHISLAAKTLEGNPGTSAIVTMLIGIVNGSNYNATRNLVHVLLPFPTNEVDEELEAARSNTATTNIAAQLIDLLNDYRDPVNINGVSRAGYNPDVIDISKDFLGISQDVRTLTAVMVAKEVPPPLAIGLFGDWGTGKTFFMRSMQKQVDEIRIANKDNPDSKYCTHTVQIEFNAWHYIDTNLWASLVSAIFDKLAKHVSPAATPEQQQAKFLSELGSTKLVVAEAEAEKTVTKKLIEEKQAELGQLQSERESKKIKLKDLRSEDISKLLTPEEATQLNESLRELGIPVLVNTIADLNSVTADIYSFRGRVNTFLVSVLNDKNRNWIVSLLVVLLIIIPVLTWVAHTYLDINKIFATIAAFVSEVTAFIAGWVIILRRGLTKAQAIFTRIDQSKRRIDEVLAQKRSIPNESELAIQTEIASLNLKEKEAITKLTAATGRLMDIEDRLRQLKDELSLNRFLSERTLSEDYRRHLGLISTIRQDFESLTKRLANSTDTKDDSFVPVDRIILYIDDLDRCPSDKVMEVLQAVHLLLAYPLFVVVVGVDPNWLLRSLRSKYSAFGDHEENDGNNFYGQTTPQHFLEKIFQIPFHLRPMTAGGFEKLMNGLLTPAIEPVSIPGLQAVATVSETKTSLAETKENTDRRENTDVGSDSQTAIVQPEDDITDTVIPEEKRQQQVIAVDKTVFKIYEESLTIKLWETTFAERLFAIIPTPRSATRFSNVYRILKASVPRENLDKFEGSAQLPGDFQVPMLLLSVLVGASSEAAQFFPKLLSEAHKEGGLRSMLDNHDENGKGGQLTTLLNMQIKTIVNLNWFPDKSELYIEWIPKVSRFSFELGQLTRV
ncbi:MAG: P-loop NTPase fold protein [Chitinophagaceae bacterium]